MPKSPAEIAILALLHLPPFDPEALEEHLEEVDRALDAASAPFARADAPDEQTQLLHDALALEQVDRALAKLAEHLAREADMSAARQAAIGHALGVEGMAADDLATLGARLAAEEQIAQALARFREAAAKLRAKADTLRLALNGHLAARQHLRRLH